MKLSLRAKIAIALAGLIGFVLFLVVVDLGVNAGRIHYGVSVAGVDVGGMTRLEAAGPLRERAREISHAPILLTAEGLNVGIPPRCFGWRPAVRESVREAYAVGREDAPFPALGDRLGAWLWGIRVDFEGRWATTELLDRYIEAWDQRLAGLGEPIDRERLVGVIEEAIAKGETGPFEFPRGTATARAMRAPLQEPQEVPLGCPDPSVEAFQPPP